MKESVAVTTPEEKKKIKYPVSVLFIVCNEFCERFSFYGMRTILSLYLHNVLLFSDDTATVIFHTFVMLCYFTPIFGAMIADSFLGKFRTIFYISIIYAIGNIIISLGSAPFLENQAVPVTMIALILIASGTGGIKPCVAAFGGDQFTLPEQEKQQKQFFSIFYFSINAGSLISTFLTPYLRQGVQCFGRQTCYPLAFGVPAVLMILALIIFVGGKPSYRIKKPEGNIVLQTFSVMKHAVSKKVANKSVKKDHWLDHALDKYDKSIIDDIKGALKVVYLLLPLPMFWALFDQQGSRWTFQASRMNGQLGPIVLQPDQMQVVNPILILAFIPIFESFLYPLCAKCNILKKSISRIFFGGCLAALAFVLSAIVETQLQATGAVVPTAQEGQLRIFNGVNCPLSVSSNIREFEGPVEIPAFDPWTLPLIDKKAYPMVQLNITTDKTCSEGRSKELGRELIIKGGKALSYLILMTNDDLSLEGPFSPDEPERSHDGYPKLRVLHSLIDKTGTFSFKRDMGTTTLDSIGNINATEYMTLAPGNRYEVSYGEENIPIMEFIPKLGGVYTVLVIQNGPKEFESRMHEITNPHSIHMMWQLPQYVVITAGEIMFSITGLEFCFTQAPASMKSLMQAVWLLTVAIGNLIVVIIAEFKLVKSQTGEFFLFSGLLFAVMLLFLFMSRGYEYAVVTKKKDDEDVKPNEMQTMERKPSSKEAEANNGIANDGFESLTESNYL